MKHAHPVSVHFQFFFSFRLTFCLGRVRNTITLALRYLFTPPPPQRQYDNHVNGSAVWPQAFRAAPRIPIVIVIIMVILHVFFLPSYLSFSGAGRSAAASSGCHVESVWNRTGGLPMMTMPFDTGHDHDHDGENGTMGEEKQTPGGGGGLFPVSSQLMFLLRTTHSLTHCMDLPHSNTWWSTGTGASQPKGIFILFDCKASGREIRTRSLLPCQGTQ